MTPTYLNTALAKLLGGASLIMKFQVSLIFFMHQPVVGIPLPRKPLSRFCSVVFIGPPCLKMPMPSLLYVTDAND